MDAEGEAVQNARLVPALCELLSTPAASTYLLPGTCNVFEAAAALLFCRLGRDRQR